MNEFGEDKSTDALSPYFRNNSDISELDLVEGNDVLDELIAREEYKSIDSSSDKALRHILAYAKDCLHGRESEVFKLMVENYLNEREDKTYKTMAEELEISQARLGYLAEKAYKKLLPYCR